MYANKATVCGNEAKLIRVTWRETQPSGHSADVSLHAAMSAILLPFGGIVFISVFVSFVANIYL